MDDYLKMDVFFAVATVSTIAIAVIAIVALVYVVRFLRTLNRIGEEVEEEAEAIRKDIDAARSRIRAFRFAKLFSPFTKRKRATRK